LLEAKRVANKDYQHARDDLKQKKICLEKTKAELKDAEHVLEDISLMVILSN